MRLTRNQIPALRFFCAALAAAAALLALPALAGTAGAASSGGVGDYDSSEAESDGGSANQTPGKYARLWDGVSVRDKRWARSTSDCESGGDPDAIGNGGMYRGAFQFMRSTWKSSPKSPGGDPIDYSYRTQAVVAIALKKRDGAGHWPVCG